MTKCEHTVCSVFEKKKLERRQFNPLAINRLDDSSSDKVRRINRLTFLDLVEFINIVRKILRSVTDNSTHAINPTIIIYYLPRPSRITIYH